MSPDTTMASQPADPSGPVAWTCPFCPLSCDHFGDAPDAQALAACGLLASSLSLALAPVQTPQAWVDGQPVAIDVACNAAARRLAAARQPLIGGLGCDVAGMRALYPIAHALRAICDGAGGDAMWHGVRALQDRGQFTTTLAEVRTRADVIVFFGGLPRAMAPLFAQRLGLLDPQVPQRHVVVLGPSEGDEAVAKGWSAQPGLTVELLPLAGADLFDASSMLMAALATPWLPAVPPAYAVLAERLKAAHYAALVGTSASLPAHGTLIVETVHRIVGQLNQGSRAAALWLGGGQGATTANQAFAWLSGLPLRTRISPRGLEHEPYLYAAQPLLEDGAVDALLWVSPFDAHAVPPTEARAGDLPVIVIGHPALAAGCQRPNHVFIPVAVPGIDVPGHVMRTDGTVLVPLWPLRSSGWPSVAQVASQILQALPPRASTQEVRP